MCLIEEVSEPDGAPVKARVFGEDLVVFRDTDGNVGVMDELLLASARVACIWAQRGLRSALPLSRLEDGREGQRDRNGFEPSCSDMTKKVKHKAYETKEWAGFVWAYMGPQDAIPEFVPPAWAPTKDTRVSIAKAILPCNWAQILEGAIDSARSSSLHSSDFVPARVGAAPRRHRRTGCVRQRTRRRAFRCIARATASAMPRCAARFRNAATHDYVRSTVFVAPGHAR